MTQTPHRGTLEVDGAPLAYEVRGEGPAVVLVHPGLADSRIWEPQVGPLAERFQVVRYDLRGFGGSPDPVGSYAHHAQLVALLDHLRLDRAHLVGCSFGAYVALATAVYAPRRIDRLVLASPVVDGVEPTECVRRFWKDEADALAVGDIDTAVELNLRTWVDGPRRGPDDVAASVRSRVAELQADVFAHGRAGEERELDPPPSAFLGVVTAPTLIVTGGLDERWILDCADALVAGLPDARPVQVAGAAHLPSLEDPTTFTQLLVEHLTSDTVGRSG